MEERLCKNDKSALTTVFKQLLLSRIQQAGQTGNHDAGDNSYLAAEAATTVAEVASTHSLLKKLRNKQKTLSLNTMTEDEPS